MANKKWVKMMAMTSALAVGIGIGGIFANSNLAASADEVIVLKESGITYQENFTHTNAVDSNGTTITTTGVKFTVPVSSQSAKFTYWDTMTTAELASGFNIKLLPEDNTVSEPKSFKIYIEDSVDETEQIIIAVRRANIGGQNFCHGWTSLADGIVWVNDYACIADCSADTTVICLGNQWGGLGGNNDVKGSVPMGGNYSGNTWVTHYTKELGFSYSAGVVYHTTGISDGNPNKRTMSDLKDDTYQANSVKNVDTTKYAELVSRYTDEYVDALFSSGEVKVTLEFDQITSKSTTSFMLTNWGGNAMTTVDTENRPEIIEPIKPIEGTLTDGTPYTANYTDADGAFGTKITLKKDGDSAKFTYWNTLTVDELAAGFAIKMTPADYEQAEVKNMKIFIRDSVDPTKQIIITAAKGANNGNARVWGYTSLADDVAFNSGWVTIAGTAQGCLGNFWEGGAENSHYGCSPMGGNFSGNTFVFDSPKELGFSYVNGIVYHTTGISDGNARLRIMSDLKNDTYQANSVSNLDSTEYADLIARYTDEYVDSLFASGKVTISFEFGGFNGENDTVSFMLTNIGGEKIVHADKEAPVVSYTDVALDNAKVFANVDEIVETLSVSAADVFDANVTLEYALLNAAGEAVTGESITVDEGYVLKVTAKDSSENEVVKEISLTIGEYYNVVFYNGDNSVLSSVRVPAGAAVTAPEATPEKAQTESTVYMFSAWDKAFDNVSSDLDVYPVFTEEARKYTITWVIGELETTTSVAYGEVPVATIEPTKEGDAQYDYTFSGWTPELVAVTGEATYTAQFSSTVKEYTITWIVDGNSTTTSVAYGEVPVFDGTPTKESTGEKVFTFSGWDKEVVAVTGEATYTAQFSEAARMYSVSIQYDNEEAIVEEYAFNATIDLAPKAIEGKKFVKWIINEVESDVAEQTITVTGSVTIVAVYEDVVAAPAIDLFAACSGSVAFAAPMTLLGAAAIVAFARKKKED